MLFLPLEEQGQQTTAIHKSSPPENTQNKAILDHVNYSTEHLRWMSTAPLSTCVECRLQQRLPVLSKFGHVAESFLKVSMPRKLLKWHLHQGIRLVMSKRFQISKWKQEPPSGLKNWQKERTLVRSQADSSSLQTSIYGSLLHEISRLEFCYCKELLLVWDWNHWVLNALKGVKIGIPFAGKEMLDWSPLGCISSWTLLFINKDILVSLMYWCIFDVWLH